MSIKLELCQNGDWNISKDGVFVGWTSHVYNEQEKKEYWIFYHSKNSHPEPGHRVFCATKKDVVDYIEGGYVLDA